MNRKQRRSQAKQGGADVAKQKAELIQQALDAAAELVKYDKLDDAERVYKGVLEHSPANIGAMFNLGIVSHRKLDYENAEYWFNRALAINPKEAETMCALGVLKLDQGDVEAATKLAEEAVAAKPTPEMYARRGGLMRELGRIDEAHENLEKAIEMKPDFVGAYYDMAISRTFAEDDPEFQAMLKLARDDTLDVNEKTQINFAIGRSYARMKDFGKAFEFYAKGNELKRGTIEYDPNFLSDMVDTTIELFTPELMEKFADVGNMSEKPIFIIGMPRSGTTLVEQIISAHPDVHGGGEMVHLMNTVPPAPNPDLPAYFRHDKATVCPALVDMFTPEFLKGIGDRYVAILDKIAPDAKYVTDKMPFNSLWAGLIRLAMPNAKIIHCTRDPMSIGLSIYLHLFTNPIPWAYDLEDIGYSCNSHKKLMDHWHALFPNDIYEANYETIVADQENESRKLLEFCGIPWDDRCLEFYKAERAVTTASVYQVRQPIYRDSLKKWEKYGDNLAPMKAVIDSGKCKPDA